MVTKDKIGLLGLITILTIYGGTTTLNLSEADKTYYCSLTNQIGIFQRLSSTAKTGYYLLDGIEYSVSCRSGSAYAPWVSLREYLSEQGLNFEDILQPSVPVDTNYSVLRGRQGLLSCAYIDGAIETYSKCYENGVFKVYAGELVCPTK